MKAAVRRKILYFIKGLYPTDDEMKAAGSIGTLTFRSIQSYSPSDFIENCDAVAGCAPEAYLKKYERADEPAKAAKPAEPPGKPSAPAAPPPPPTSPPNPFAKPQ